MVVEQEMADVYPPEPEQLSEFLPKTDWGSCGYGNCLEFAEVLLGKEVSPQTCPDLDDEFAKVLATIVELNKDPIPYNIMMEQVPCELIEINVPTRALPF